MPEVLPERVFWGLHGRFRDILGGFRGLPLNPSLNGFKPHAANMKPINELLESPEILLIPQKTSSFQVLLYPPADIIPRRARRPTGSSRSVWRSRRQISALTRPVTH